MHKITGTLQKSNFTKTDQERYIMGDKAEMTEFDDIIRDFYGTCRQVYLPSHGYHPGSGEE